MDEEVAGWVIFATIVLIITVIVLIYKNYEKKKEITELETKLQQANANISFLDEKLKKYDNTLQLLQAEHLKIKDELISRVDTYCQSEEPENIHFPLLHISKRYKKMVDLIIAEYQKTFTDVDKAILLVSNIMADYYTYPILLEELKAEEDRQYYVRRRALTIAEIRKETDTILKAHYQESYKKNYQYAKVLQNVTYEKIEELMPYNTRLIPYASKIISDIETANFEILAKSLDWGSSYERMKKVASIREIRKMAQEQIEKSKWSEYQLSYLLALYPALQEVIETDYKDLQISYDEVTEADPVRNYLSVDEWKSLSTTEKNQLALDRYIESRKKSKWQIGRDYELYIGYLYQQKGYDIDYFGSYMGMEDLGRDLIATKNNKTLIIQCKYWSKEKKIHEKHIMQLYGSIIAYRIENSANNVKGLLITNIELSDTAKKFAEILKIQYVENEPLGSFPRIKCNIGYDEFGYQTHIYHLPMDFQYDKTKIDKPGEMMVTTVAEAEAAGFRRAYKWHGNQ